MSEKLKYVGIQIATAYEVRVTDDGRFGLVYNDVINWSDPGVNVLSQDQLKMAAWLVDTLNTSLDVEKSLES